MIDTQQRATSGEMAQGARTERGGMALASEDAAVQPARADEALWLVAGGG